MNDRQMRGLDEGPSRAESRGSTDAGFGVDPAALTRYAERSGELADELKRMARQQVSEARRIGEDGFGKAGRESGFAAALNHFAGSLEHQVNSLAATTDRFGTVVGRAARMYSDSDTDAGDAFLHADRSDDRRPGGRSIRD